MHLQLGGPAWEVQLGRRDSTTASRTTADADLPLSNMTLTELIDNFKKQGLDETDLVVLSGGHTLGFARCIAFGTAFTTRQTSMEHLQKILNSYV